MKKKQLYIGILSVACCALVAIGITLHLLYPKEQIKNLVKTPPVLRLKPQPADTLKKKPVKKMDFNISGTLRDKEGKGVAGVIVSDGFNCVKTDAQGRTVNFENTVIIMTTNAGSERSSAVSGFTSSGERVTKDRTERALADFLRPEFLNRIDEIITFRHLDENDMSRIAGLMLKRLADHLAERGIALKYTPEVPDFIAHEAYSEKYGARNMRRYIERNVEDGIATALIEKSATAISGIGLSVADGKIKINTI